jgi:radical SAM superfamily enzyme YgiQ (UPF0313 family)
MMYASYIVDPSYTREDFRSLLAYVRKMKHQQVIFTIMTPLPGTELHENRGKDLLSRKPELYDLVHTVLPTTLPLPEFYREFADLYTRAVPLYRLVPTVFNFGLHGILITDKDVPRISGMGKGAMDIERAGGHISTPAPLPDIKH